MTTISNTTKVAERVAFLQEGGSSPASQPLYRGATSFDGWNTPLGDVNPTYLPSRVRPNDWDIVDITQGSEGLPNSGFTVRVNDALYKKWRAIQKRRCPVTIYAKKDDCGRKDDPTAYQFINIFLDTRMTDFTDSLLNPLQGDDQTTVELTGSFSARTELIFYPIRFEVVADAAVDADVLDGFYSGVSSCGGKCGGRKDDCAELYVLTALNQASLGLSSRIVFSTDDKQTFNAVDIPVLGGTVGSAIGDAGNFLIVVSENQAAHNYITFDDLQNLDTTAWVQVTSGYVEPPIDIYVKTPEEIFLAGNAGYAYKLDSPTETPTVLTDGSITTDDLRHVDGFNSTVVFAGDNGKVLVSQNDGDTLTETPVVFNGSTLTGNITALSVLNDTSWFIAIGGNLYYTLDSGNTYALKGLPGTNTVINDIAFVEGQIGYIAAESGGSGVVYRSYDAGYSWSKKEPAIGTAPTAQRYNVVAPCGTNEVAIGGRVSAGGDGILAIGA